MSCFHPIKGFRARKVGASGKRGIVFNTRDGFPDLPVSVPCGQCIGCRLERSRQWALRCVHEAQLHQDNCFITLTYDDDHLPVDRSLNLEHFQKFMKRLRKRYGDGIRFFHCGEYGENFGRPHYHACLFNFDFSDRELWSVREGVRLYTSKSLQDLWTFGFSTVGEVTFESAAYVARYVMKKVTGPSAEDHYIYVDEITGQVYERKPGYVTMSRRPGIGKAWIDTYMDDVYPGDFVVLNGVKCRPPRFYDGVFERVCAHDADEIKHGRVRRARGHAFDNTSDRLEVREEVCLSRMGLLKRTLT